MRLSVDQAKAKNISFVLKDSSNNPINLVGLVATFEVYLEIPKTNSVAVISKVITHDDDANGLYSVVVDDTDTDLTPAVYVYRFSVAYDTDDNRVLDSGTLQIVGDDTDLINQIKAKYGLGFDYYTMKGAIDYAKEQTLKNAFLSEKGTGLNTDTNNTIKICNYIMDSNFDGSITTADITVYEYLKDYPYTVTDLTANISSLILNTPEGHSYIVMDDSYPSTGQTLAVEYKRGAKQYEEALQSIDNVLSLYTLYYLFRTLEVTKLQRGLTSRSINGVTIDFNKEAIDSFISILDNWIATERLKILPFKACFGGFDKSPIARSVQISKGY